MWVKLYPVPRIASQHSVHRPCISTKVASPTFTYVCEHYHQFYRSKHVLGALHVARTLFSLATDAAGMGTFLSSSHSNPDSLKPHNRATATGTHPPSSPWPIVKATSRQKIDGTASQSLKVRLPKKQRQQVPPRTQSKLTSTKETAWPTVETMTNPAGRGQNNSNNDTANNDNTHSLKTRVAQNEEKNKHGPGHGERQKQEQQQQLRASNKQVRSTERHNGQRRGCTVAETRQGMTHLGLPLVGWCRRRTGAAKKWCSLPWQHVLAPLPRS